MDGDNELKITWKDVEGNPRRQIKPSDAGICNTNEFAVDNNTYDIALESTGILSELETSIATFPNPFENRLTVQIQLNTNNDGDYMLRIHNMLGGVVYEGKATSSYGNLSLDIDTRSFAKGSYVLTLVGQDQADKVVNRLIIKQ